MIKVKDIYKEGKKILENGVGSVWFCNIVGFLEKNDCL